MAWLESIFLTRVQVTVSDGKIVRTPIDELHEPDFPQICWGDGRPWRECNQWLLARLESDKNVATVSSDARALHAYAQWLEKTSTDWLAFPIRQRDRCLVRYRGALKRAMVTNDLRPSTASMRMRVVIQFYRWLRDAGILDPETPLWNEKPFVIENFDATGFIRTIKGTTTDLKIPNRPPPGLRLEDGLLPLSEGERDKLLSNAKGLASPELYLMLALGFFTGMRLGSICDLKVETIFNAARHPLTDKVHFLAIGPNARPSVHTKFGVTGQAFIPTSLLETLRDYCNSTRRFARQQLAADTEKNLVFLTRYGNSYVAKRGRDKSASVNVELHRLKKIIATEDPTAENFKFHQSRATFATQVAQIASGHVDAATAVGIVMELLMHADERTSMHYIKFVQQTPLKVDLSNEFTRTLLGGLQRTMGDAGGRPNVGPARVF